MIFVCKQLITAGHMRPLYGHVRQERTGNAVHYNGSLLYLQSDKISIGPYGDFFYYLNYFFDNLAKSTIIGAEKV
jgi:hypothetical protein